MSAEAATNDTHEAPRKNPNLEASLVKARPAVPVVRSTPVARQQEKSVTTGPKASDAATGEPGSTSTAPASENASIMVTSVEARDQAEAEAFAVDSSASSREQSPADTDSATSRATKTESCTTNGSPSNEEYKVASSDPETPEVGQNRRSRVCSPDFCLPQPPPDMIWVTLKLWDIYILQERGYRIELPCHTPRDPWNTNSTPPSAYWMSDAPAPSPWAVGPASSSESEDEAPSPPGVKTGASSKMQALQALQAQARALMPKRRKFGKRKWTGKVTPCEESVSGGETPESGRKRQKRWIGP